MNVFDHFQALDIRVGRVTGVHDVTEARGPIYRMTVDFGDELGEKTCGAGIKDHYSTKDLEGRLVVCITNLEPRRIVNFASECMLLAADVAGTPVLLQPDRDVPPGTRIR